MVNRRKRFLAYSMMLAMIPFVACTSQSMGESGDGSEGVVTATLHGDEILVFLGVPTKTGWGENLVFVAQPSTVGTWTMGSPALGGIPLIDIWSKDGGVALFNVADQHEAVTFELVADDSGSVTIKASGGSNLVKFEHTGDYFQALRELALQMKDRGVVVKPAPAWAFDPIWETYGFEETWHRDDVIELLPTLLDLGIKTITLDSGWYGSGTVNWEAGAGDFTINEDVIGTEEDFTNFLQDLYVEGFKVRLWWTPGVAEKGTELHAAHPDWFHSKVTPSTGDADTTGDWYLDPTHADVIEWNRELVERFVGYGVHGFKQDDVYQIATSDPTYHQAYAALLAGNYGTATKLVPDFVINTCNCGIAQNLFDFPGENQLITSDPVGPKQFRLRAKYLHALNVNGAAILGDHIELTQGDVGREELSEPLFYDRIMDVDFASTVALGMVLQTKLTTADPTDTYKKWFGLYSEYKFYEMEWVNIPYLASNPLETYLLADGDARYFSFFTSERDGTYEGDVVLGPLVAGTSYSVYDIVNKLPLDGFTADATTQTIAVNFMGSLVVSVNPTP